MKKIGVNTCMIMLSALASSSMVAMSRGWDETYSNFALNVEISNQTKSDITITEGPTIITIPSYSNKNFKLKPVFAGGFRDRGLAAQYPIKILTNQGEFDLSWWVSAYAEKGVGQLNLDKENSDDFIGLARPFNPIIIFEENKNLPIIKELEE